VSTGLRYMGPATDGLSAAGELLWVTNNEGVAVFDIRDPLNPIQMGYYETVNWALNVHAKGSTAYVADWEGLIKMEAFIDRQAPHIDAHPGNLYFIDEGKLTHKLKITNRGNADLKIVGASADDSRLSVKAEALEVAPGQSTMLHISFDDDGQPLSTKLCLATNDPDQPLSFVRVGDSSHYKKGLQVGDEAADFILPEINTQQLYTLSDYVGSPVFLVFFSSW